MKKIIVNYLSDKLTLVGFIMVILSTALFVLMDSFKLGTDPFGAFVINYLMSVGYLIAVFIGTFKRHRGKLSAGKTEHTALLLVLWFISAFALNREMNVFDDSADWLSIWVVESSIAVLLAGNHRLLSGVPRYFTFFFLGAALLLFTYYSFYLMQLYIISIIGLLALGISLHSYVPLCLAILTAGIIIKAGRQDKIALYTALAGFTVPIIAAVFFLVSWNNTNSRINLIINQNTLNEGKLPAWVAVSQQLAPTPVTERILKAGLVYHEVTARDNFFFGGMPNRSFDEKKVHDPLVVLATLFFERPNLNETERINILKAMYNSRHQAQERLWSGDELQTISVISNVKLYPEYRMAYTEKTLTVRNNSRYGWSNQEAIYTFHLPEGSVVSSLSLWIKGKEAKSRLTTKAKADSAYHQIVGVEQHDPSVVHWQEGNTISVRVFPCTTDENRKFRLGITSPLSLNGKRLVYENAYFDGPQATSALETLQLSFSSKPAKLQVPAIFKQSGADVYTADRNYQPGWEISCEAPELAKTAFAFADSTYMVKNFEPQYEAFNPAAVYLDVNSAWTKDDFHAVYSAAMDAPVYVYYNKLLRLKQENIDELYELLRKQNFSLFPVNEIAQPVYVYYNKLLRLKQENIDELYELLRKQNFSLFPVNEIAQPELALLITKGKGESPNLNELEGSGFAVDLSRYLKAPRHIRMYNIGDGLTPYLKTLKELRVFNYAGGTEEKLLTMLTSKQFQRDQENDSTVVISNAGLIIQKAPGLKAVDAPDHLLRLFAYNDIMKRVGPNYFIHNYVQPETIREAEQAYVVSPVSSLIVLETQEDYKRFGIDENKDSLKNASMKSSGAVPEPQEWMLIILATSIVGMFIYRGKRGVPQW